MYPYSLILCMCVDTDTRTQKMTKKVKINLWVLSTPHPYIPIPPSTRQRVRVMFFQETRALVALRKRKYYCLLTISLLHDVFNIYNFDSDVLTFIILLIKIFGLLIPIYSKISGLAFMTPEKSDFLLEILFSKNWRPALRNKCNVKTLN